MGEKTGARVNGMAALDGGKGTRQAERVGKPVRLANLYGLEQR